MVLEIIAERHGVKLIPTIPLFFAQKLDMAILHAACRRKCCVVLEEEDEIKNWLPDSEFQEMLELLDGNGIRIEHSGNRTYVWFSWEEVQRASIIESVHDYDGL